MPGTDTHLGPTGTYEDTDWLSVGKAAIVLGVSVQTLQRWDREGILIAHRTPTNQRRYLRSELDDFRPTKAA